MDNAHMESFFHSFKEERIHGERCSSESELRVALNGYINQFYNQKRLHPGVGYNSPAEYEQIATLDLECQFYRGKITPSRVSTYRGVIEHDYLNNY
jgi:hypothetical protein